MAAINSAAAIILTLPKKLVKADLHLLLRLLSYLPLPILHALGAALGWLALLHGKYRGRLLKNMTIAGQNKTGALRRVAMELGKGMAELPRIWLGPLSRVDGLVREVRGWEHLQAASAQGKGVLLLAPHLGCWEICGMYIAQRTPTTALYTPPPQAWVHAMMRQGRERTGAKTVPPDNSGVRALLTRLRAGEAAFILPDQVASKGEGQWVRMLDTPSYMPSLPYRLLQRTDATPLIVFAKRLSWGRGYRLYIEPVDTPAQADAPELAKTVTQALSRVIRQHPEQYLWSYSLYQRRSYMPPIPEEL